MNYINSKISELLSYISFQLEYIPEKPLVNSW